MCMCEHIGMNVYVLHAPLVSFADRHVLTIVIICILLHVVGYKFLSTESLSQCVHFIVLR